MNEYRKLMESLETINSKGSQFDEDYNPMKADEVPPAPQTDPMDLVTMDVPLLIRLFELMKETVQDDAELHHITTQILNVSKQSDEPLTMEKYNEILNGQSDEPVTESNRYASKKAKYHYEIPDNLIPQGAKSSDEFIEVNGGYVPLRMFTQIDPNTNNGFNFQYKNFIMKYKDRHYVSGTSNVNEEFSDNRGEFIVMPLPGLMGSPVTGWREMQKYFNGKTPLYVRADSGVDGVIISPKPVDNEMLARATEQEGLWK